MAEGVFDFLFLTDTRMVGLNFSTPVVDATRDKNFSVLMCPDARPAARGETTFFDAEF